MPPKNNGLGELQTRSDTLEKWSVLPRPRVEPRFLGHPADSVLTELTTRSRLEGKVRSISEPFLFRTGFLFCALKITSTDRFFRILLCALYLSQDTTKYLWLFARNAISENKHSDFRNYGRNEFWGVDGAVHLDCCLLGRDTVVYLKCTLISFWLPFIIFIFCFMLLE